MNFNEKLDFLMNITKTKNSDLAMYTSLDSSYISRLRRGKRKLSNNENFVLAMAEYFIKNIKEDYQKKSIFDLISRSGFLIKEDLSSTEILYKWLKDGKVDEVKVVEGFIENFSSFKFKKTNTWKYTENKMKTDTNNIEIYTGIQGKREGVLNFLSLATSSVCTP